MEFSDHSWHCVDEIRSGKRYSLVYSFWIENSATDSTTEATRDGSGTVTEQELNDIRSLLRELKVDAVPHSSRSLMDHVNGVYQILRQWQCDGDICKVALVHFCLGTPTLPYLVPDEQIEKIRTLIGERAMFLLQLYSRLDLPSLRRIVSGDKFTESGGAVALSVRDKRSLVALVWANALDQSRYVPHAEQMDAELKQLFRETSHLLPPRSDKDIRSLLSLAKGH
jgi:hypothetical protein